MRNSSWKKDGGLERGDEAAGRRTGAPEAGWRLQPKPGGPGHQDVVSGRKMTRQIEAERPQSQDAGPGRKMRARDAKKTAAQEKRTPGKLRSGTGSNGAVRTAKKRAGTVKTAVGTDETGFWALAGRGIVSRKRSLASRPTWAIPRRRQWPAPVRPATRGRRAPRRHLVRPLPGVHHSAQG